MAASLGIGTVARGMARKAARGKGCGGKKGVRLVRTVLGRYTFGWDDIRGA